MTPTNSKSVRGSLAYCKRHGPMTRQKVSDADIARAELSSSRAKPDWRVSSHYLPFHELSPDEFEVFCFLLLLKEHPGDRIYYYGKTGDRGRDIVHHLAGKVRLVQCKRFTSGNVGVGEIREELAKLCDHSFSGHLPEPPDEVLFYVVPDVTSDAGDLIRQQALWRQDAPKALRDFLKHDPTQELLTHAHQWWPEPDFVAALSLTERARRFNDLIDEFFSVRSVVVGTIPDVQKAMREELQPVKEMIEQLQPLVSKQHPEPVVVPPESLNYDDVVSAFYEVSKELLSWPTTLGSNRWLNRVELDEIAARIRGDTRSTTILVGPPGSGKSALLAKLGQTLSAEETLVVALKADLLSPSIDSLGSLSEQLHLPTMITDCIRQVAATRKVLVLIDQLDAIADLLDLRAGRLNALLTLVKQLNGHENVHVVCSCRTFEFGHDTRLTSIDAEKIELTLPAWEDVAAILQERGVIPGEWPAECRTLLRTPQHLKVFLQRLKGGAEDQLFTTYQQLLDDLWKQRVRSHEHAQLLMDMADMMANQETIWLPLVRFEEREHLMTTLEAENILMRSENGMRIGFRHQTLFEHARARAFARGPESLCTYVMDRQDALFVRPVLWSSLHYLRGADPDAYHREMGSLWQKPVRKHVRHLLTEFLGQVSSPTPSDAEQVWLIGYLQKPGFRNTVLAAIRGNHAWFSILADTHFPSIMRLPTNEAWPMVGILGSAWKTDRATCLRLIKQEWLPDAASDRLIFRTLESLSEWDREALDVAAHVVERSDFPPANVMGLANAIADTYPELALILVRCVLFRELMKVEAEPDPVPPPLPPDAPESDHIVQRFTFNAKERFRHLLEHTQEWYGLGELAEAAPAAFVSEIWPWLTRVIEHLLEDSGRQINAYRRDWSLATKLSDAIEDRGIYTLTGAMDAAIQETARLDPAAFLAHLEQEKDKDMLFVQRLLCRGLREIVSTHSDVVLDFLTADLRRLMLGNIDDEYQDTIALITAVVPYLTDAQVEKLESAITAWTYLPSYADFDPDGRRVMTRSDRESRLRLFTAIAPEKLSQQVQAIVRSDKQVFPHYASRRTCPVTCGVVTSPMSAEQMGKARNGHIVNLFVTLAQENRKREFLRGGIHEAAIAFKEFAKVHPERAADILSRLTPGQHNVPAGYGVEGISESAFPSNTLFDIILQLDNRGFGGEDFRVSIGRSLERRLEEKNGLPDTICTLLERWLGEWPDPTPTEGSQQSSRKQSDDDRPHTVLWQHGGFVTIPFGSYHLLNALTYGYLLREPPAYDRWMSLLEVQVERTDQVETWQVLSRELRYLQNCDHARAEWFLRRLFEKCPAVRDSVHGAILLTHAWWFLPAAATLQFLHDMRDGPWADGPQTFGELLALRCMIFPEDPEANRELSQLLDHKGNLTEKDFRIRTGLAYTAAHRWSNAGHRSKANNVLLGLIPQADAKISHAIMHTFVRTDVLCADEETKSLLCKLHTHPNVVTSSLGSFFEERLEDVLSTYPDLVLSLCEDVVGLRETALKTSQTGSIEATAELTNMALTFQRLGGPYRGRGLDLFERLLDIGVHDAFVTLNELDKRIPNLAMPRAVPARSRRTRRRRRTRESS